MGMQTEGMIADMVRNLQSDSATLRMLCARAIFRLAEEEETRDLVRYNGGLDPLVEMLSDNTNQDDMVTIYLKCRFIQFNRCIVKLLKHQETFLILRFSGANGSSYWCNMEMCNRQLRKC